MFSVIIFNLLVHILQSALSAEITAGPNSMNTTLNMSVNFTCQGIGDLITFYVNDKLASTPNIMNRGFELLRESTKNGTVTRTLMATAYEKNNDTNITCEVIPLPADTSLPAVLMIQGILDGVGDLTATVIDGSSVSLTWTPPYSLDNVPITGYNIITSDSSNIQVTSVNTPYHILTSSDPDPCNITTVSVGAINDVGTSQYKNVSFYYQRDPHEFFFNGELFLNKSQLLLKIFIDISNLCIGQYPNEIDSVAVDPNGNIINYTNITIYSQHQQVNEYLPVLPIEWDTFIVNLTLINRAGKSNKTIKFGSFIDINSSIINCSTISVSWERPSVSDGVNIHNYTLLIYDDISHTLVDRVSVNGSVTSYQFEDDDLFHHRYTYVIYGNNELGQGNYSNMTFSYQRVPKSAKDDTTFIISPSSNNNISLYFMIPIVLECTGEAPENISIEITCDNSTLIYNQTYPVEYANHPMNITGNISVELTQHYQRCSLSIVFSNSAGHSEPFIKTRIIPEAESGELHMLPFIIASVLFMLIIIVIASGLLMTLGILIKVRKQPSAVSAISKWFTCKCLCHKKKHKISNSDNAAEMTMVRNSSSNRENHPKPVLTRPIQKLSDDDGEDSRMITAITTNEIPQEQNKKSDAREFDQTSNAIYSADIQSKIKEGDKSEFGIDPIYIQHTSLSALTSDITISDIGSDIQLITDTTNSD